MLHICKHERYYLPKTQEVGRKYADKFYIAEERCRWYGTVKVRYRADISVVEPPSFESDCEMQERKD